MLYNFSLEKCEKFFCDPHLAKIFSEYVRVFDERMEANPVLARNREVYLSTIELVKEKFGITV